MDIFADNIKTDHDERQTLLNLIIKYVPKYDQNIEMIIVERMMSSPFKKVKVFGICIDEYYMYDYIANKRYGKLDKKTWKRYLEYLFNVTAKYPRNLVQELQRQCMKLYYITIEKNHNIDHNISEYCIFLNCDTNREYAINDLSKYNIHVSLNQKWCGLIDSNKCTLIHRL